MDKELELMLDLILRHLKGIVSAIEKFREAKRNAATR